MDEIRVMRRTDPWIPASHPDFVWTAGANVQATWRRYGWTPPSESMAPPPTVVKEEPPRKAVRRVK
jgi:hypothetical protein